jgi:hypothetical protein
VKLRKTDEQLPLCSLTFSCLGSVLARVCGCGCVPAHKRTRIAKGFPSLRATSCPQLPGHVCPGGFSQTPSYQLPPALSPALPPASQHTHTLVTNTFGWRPLFLFTFACLCVLCVLVLGYVARVALLPRRNCVPGPIAMVLI